MMQCIKCGQKGCLTFYGTYSRTLKIHSRAVRLTVRRVICGACGGTHALLPSLIVPYSQIPKEDQQEILQKTEANESAESVLEKNNLIDENHVKYIVRQFRRYWKERIAALRLTLFDSLTEQCLSHYSQQFMQIRKTPNVFFPVPT